MKFVIGPALLFPSVRSGASPRHRDRQQAPGLVDSSPKIDMNARRPVNAAICLVRGPDLRDQRGVGLSTPRWLPLRSRIIAAGETPAVGTWWQSGMRPDSRSRTGTLRWDRVRLPSKPGRGF
jgi:hypothetical protein